MNIRLQMIKSLLIKWIHFSLILEKKLGLSCTKTKSTIYYLDKPQASSFFLLPTNSIEIENINMSLSSTKASGPLSISFSLIKTLKGVLSIPLQLLFNCSFSTGSVPDQFKVATVVPIHKKRVQLFILPL